MTRAQLHTLREIRDTWLIWSRTAEDLRALGLVGRDRRQDRYVLTEAGERALEGAGKARKGKPG